VYHALKVAVGGKSQQWSFNVMLQDVVVVGAIGTSTTMKPSRKIDSPAQYGYLLSLI